jgi:hypothetical protein
VEDFCEKIGISFVEVFAGPVRTSEILLNPYEGFKWIVLPHSVISTGVLHSFHNNGKQSDDHPWEEWLLWEDRPKYNSLFTIHQSEEQVIFEGLMDDDDHPKELLGHAWFCTVEDNLKPMLF